MAELHRHFCGELARRTHLDLQGGDADGDSLGKEASENGDRELDDLQAMMGALAPLSGEALLAVAEEQEEEKRWGARLPSWG